MATELVVRVTDDLDRIEGKTTEAAETITLGFQGAWYELDLSEAHLRELAAFLKPYLKAGRQEGGAPAAGGPAGSKAARDYARAMRAFADERGIAYKTETGKIYYSRSLRLAFEAHLRELAQTSSST